MVVVDAENRRRPNSLAQLGQPLSCHAERLARLEDRGVILGRRLVLRRGYRALVEPRGWLAGGRSDPNTLPAQLDQHLHLLDHLFHTTAARRSEAWDAFALFAAQQLVDRDIESFGRDIEQGNVDRRDRRLEHAPALEIL